VVVADALSKDQILTEMDGFSSREGIIVLAATNQPDVLDKALLRPGRFDRRVVVHLPDQTGREAILKVHTRGVPLAHDVSLGELAAVTPGFSGADLRNLVNEAALLAVRCEQHEVRHARGPPALGVSADHLSGGGKTLSEAVHESHERGQPG
jgi:cell division protease FtsH